MEERIQIDALVRQMTRLHKKAVSTWADKSKYLTSARKSAKELENLAQKILTPEREKLMLKLNAHINRIMVEYAPVVEELLIINKQARRTLEQVSTILQFQKPSEDVVTAANMAKQIENIVVQASDFAKA